MGRTPVIIIALALIASLGVGLLVGRMAGGGDSDPQPTILANRPAASPTATLASAGSPSPLPAGTPALDSTTGSPSPNTPVVGTPASDLPDAPSFLLPGTPGAGTPFASPGATPEARARPFPHR